MLRDFEQSVGESMAKAALLSSWTLGWCCRQLAKGALFGIGAWLGWAVIGARIVCSN